MTTDTMSLEEYRAGLRKPRKSEEADRGRSEEQDQEALFDFLARIEGRVPPAAWAFHVPNGGHRLKHVAVALKRQGVKRGVLDIWLPFRRDPYVGFVCELKVGKNKPTPEQEAWLDHLERQGWYPVVCWEWEDAARELLRYLGYEPKEFGL